MRLPVSGILGALFFVGAMAWAQSDVCYPGLDCPGDIPKKPGAGGENPPPYSPGPAPQPSYPQPQSPPYGGSPQAGNQNCSDPYTAMALALFGQPVQACNLPATHCCFEDGSFVPLAEPGSIAFADFCYTQINYFGALIPVQGLGCRR